MADIFHLYDIMGNVNTPKEPAPNPAAEATAIALTPAANFLLRDTGAGSAAFRRMRLNGTAPQLTNLLESFAADVDAGTNGKYQMRLIGTPGFFPTAGSQKPYIDLISLTPPGVRDAAFEVTVSCTFERGPVLSGTDERSYVNAIGLMFEDVSFTGDSGDSSQTLAAPVNGQYAVQILQDPISAYNGVPAGTVVFKGTTGNLNHTYLTVASPVGPWESTQCVRRLYLIAQHTPEGGGTYTADTESETPAISAIYISVKFIGGLQDAQLVFTDNDL